MNKIYKVVWSKVKNCYVVVSELAKNVITGSVKSAKVGVAPMARGLALGAMMAFVITGSAMYDGMAEAARYEEGAGQAQIVGSQGTNKDRLVGGWGGSYEAGMATAFSGDLTVNVGTWDYIIGGNYSSGVEDPSELKVNIEKTQVVINDGVYAKHVVGGTAANDVNKLITGNADRTAHLVINGGTFGDASLWVHGTLENLVVGGDHVKGYAAGWPPSNNSSDLNLASSLTEIKGGTFNSLIIGGSLANQYGAAIGSGVFKTTVDKAETIITGGTFNQAIVAGGVAIGGEAVSNVDEAILSVSNAMVNSDIYTGGMVRYVDTNGVEGAEVGKKSTVTVEKSKVNNIYGVRGYADFNNGWKFMPEDDKYPNGSSAEGFGVHPDTDLTISDSEIVNEVDIRKGSITLKGDNTIGALNAGADATVDVSGNADVGTLKVEKAEVNFNGNGTLDVGKVETKNMTYTADDGVTEATVVYNNPNPTVTNTVIEGETITLTGVNLEVNSDYDGAAYSGGVIKNTTINSDSTVTINQKGEDHVLGQGKNTIEAEKIVLNAAAGAAIYLHGGDSATLEAKTIKMTSNFTQDMVSYNGSAAGVYAAGGTVEITGFDSLDIDVLTDVEGEGGHGIIANGSEVNIIGSKNSSITVDSMGRGALVALGEGQLNIETKDLTAGTTALEGGKEVRKNSTLGAQGAGSEVNLKATGNVTLNAEEGMNAIGADAGASVVVDAAGDVGVNGQIETSGKSGGKRGNITVAGNNVSIDTVGEDAVRGYLGNIALTAQNELNITSQDKDAIQSVVSKVELNAKTVNLTAGYDGWGINATGDAGNDITVNAENVNVVGELGGIQNLAKSTIVVNTDNIMIDAGENEALRAVKNGTIEVNADKSAAITGDITASTGGSVTVNFEGEKSLLNGAVTTDETSKTTLTFNNGAIWNVTGASRVSTFNSNQSKIAFEKDAYVHVDAGSGSLILTESGETADAFNTAAQLSTVAAKLGVGEEAKDITAKVVMAEGKVKGETTGVVSYKTKAEEGYYYGYIAEEDVTEKVNTTNASINNILNVALMAWRAENNDMNKRLGELRNANGEHGVWVRMVNGESEYKDVENEYKTYQLGYDEKLSVDPSWTVGAAVSYTEADTTADKASGENKHKGFSIYGSKLNDDGSFVDLIAKVARIEHDFNIAGEKGDWSSNGYSLSAEYGKRLEQGNGLWIEPQVELTYGKISSAECELAGRIVTLEDMESLVGRVGFSLGKDIKQGNIYARASYLYDFEGETTTKFSDGKDTRSFEQDLGGGWWEVGVGANINLSKATYIYADVEKTFGGEVDTNWQWNLGVRYSF